METNNNNFDATIEDGANSLYTKEEIIRNKEVILPALYDWAQTFIDNDSENLDDVDSYDIVNSLAERFEQDICTDDDYDEINFHIYQIDYNYYTDGEDPIIEMDCLVEPFN